MTIDLTNRIALVTGASRGVGFHIARALALAGARVALVARSPDALGEVAEELRSHGAVCEPLPADCSRPAEVERLKRDVEQLWGPPSVLVNAAGMFGPIHPIRSSHADEWIATLMVNTVAPYLTCRAFVGSMVDSGWGRIVNVSSAASLATPGPLNSAYATSKVALNHFTRQLAAEVSGSGVTANVIHPGEVKTEMWADIRDRALRLGELGEGMLGWVRLVEETGGDPPDKAAGLVLRLVSEHGADFNGQFLWIEGGLQTPLPSWS